MNFTNYYLRRHRISLFKLDTLKYAEVKNIA